MGRLQKKKTVGQKARKKQKADTSAEGAGVGGEAVQSSSGLSGSVAAKRGGDTSPAKTAPQAKGALKPVSGGRVDRWMQFLREVNVELKKVVWPTRKQTVASTVVVIVLVIIISMFLGVVDMGLSGLVRVVLQ